MPTENQCPGCRVQPLIACNNLHIYAMPRLPPTYAEWAHFADADIAVFSLLRDVVERVAAIGPGVGVLGPHEVVLAVRACYQVAQFLQVFGPAGLAYHFHLLRNELRQLKYSLL
ncbi:hypothetical protein ACJJTC_012500 [Scirpophaga incertulas]